MGQAYRMINIDGIPHRYYDTRRMDTYDALDVLGEILEEFSDSLFNPDLYECKRIMDGEFTFSINGIISQRFDKYSIEGNDMRGVEYDKNAWDITFNFYNNNMPFRIRLNGEESQNKFIEGIIVYKGNYGSTITLMSSMKVTV